MDSEWEEPYDLERYQHRNSLFAYLPNFTRTSCKPVGLKICFLDEQQLPRWLSGKESASQCRRCKRRRFNPWVRKVPWNRKRQPTPVFLPGESHRQSSLVGHSQGVVKSRTEHRCNQCKQQSNHLILIGPPIYPELTEWETLRVWSGCFNKHFRWFCYSLKFEKHCWKQCYYSPPIYRDTIQWAFHCLALCSQQNLSSSYHADII